MVIVENESNDKGYSFGKGAIREQEWEFLKSFIEENEIHTILEIGAGYSTYLFSQLEGVSVVSYETNQKWIDHVKETTKGKDNVEIHYYTYPNFPESTRYFDLVLVDGPSSSQGSGRKESMKFAKQHGKYVAIHDYKRKEEFKSSIEVFGEKEPIYHVSCIAMFDNTDHATPEDIKDVSEYDSSKYAIFITTNDNYLHYTNVLLNSIEKNLLYNVDVFLIHDELQKNPDYIKRAKNEFTFNLIDLPIDRKDFDLQLEDRIKPVSNNLFMKQSRFKYIQKHGKDYDAIAMLDADMFIVSRNIMNLFQLVHGTNKLIGCNESFKWKFNEQYTMLDDEGKEIPILDREVNANKFHCSVPIIFDLKKWDDVFEFYNKLAFRAVDSKNPEEKRVGDMYCWNLSVYKNYRENDVILFPIETMTQVHQTNARPYTGLRVVDGMWLTNSGDEVFTIHGRIGDKWEEGERRNFEKVMTDLGVSKEKKKLFEGKFNATISAIRKEWEMLSTYRVSLT